jgi:hypothetical protein
MLRYLNLPGLQDLAGLSMPRYLNLPGLQYLVGLSMPENSAFISRNYIN